MSESVLDATFFLFSLPLCGRLISVTESVLIILAEIELPDKINSPVMTWAKEKSVRRDRKIGTNWPKDVASSSSLCPPASFCSHPEALAQLRRLIM